MDDLEETSKDYSALYSENNNSNNINGNKTELHDIFLQSTIKESNFNDFDTHNKYFESQKRSNLLNNKQNMKNSTRSITDITETFDMMNKQMQTNDFFIRLIAINLSIEEDKDFDSDTSFNKNMKAFLPWEDEYYSGKSKFNLYTNENIPEWLNISNKSK